MKKRLKDIVVTVVACICIFAIAQEIGAVVCYIFDFKMVERIEKKEGSVVAICRTARTGEWTTNYFD